MQSRVTQESDLVDKNVAYHNTLNPKAWVNDSELKPEVRDRLLEIAEVFITSLRVPSLDIKDIVLTGSNANYNWTQFSDFDVHVIVDYSSIAVENIVAELFRAKKDLWNRIHDIKVRNHDVELYVEDAATPPVSQGVYSLQKDTWLKKPNHNPPSIDDAAVEAKVIDLMQMIDYLLETDSDDVESYTMLSEKISKMRKAGLVKGGEYSTENLAFKVLRNEGYMDKLQKAKLAATDRALTLEHLRRRQTGWTTDSRINFVNTFLSEAPEGIGKTDLADKIEYFVRDYQRAGVTPERLGDGLMKLEGQTVLFYWYEDKNGKMSIGAELEKAPYCAIVRELGKYNKGVPPFASDLYLAISADLQGSLRITSDVQLSDEGLNVWARLLQQGKTIGVYDNETPGQSYTEITSVEELKKYFKHDDRSFRRYQYVISEGIGAVDIRHQFETRRSREQNPTLL